MFRSCTYVNHNNRSEKPREGRARRQIIGEDPDQTHHSNSPPSPHRVHMTSLSSASKSQSSPPTPTLTGSITTPFGDSPPPPSIAAETLIRQPQLWVGIGTGGDTKPKGRRKLSSVCDERRVQDLYGGLTFAFAHRGLGSHYYICAIDVLFERSISYSQ